VLKVLEAAGEVVVVAEGAEAAVVAEVEVGDREVVSRRSDAVMEAG
jgi:hypothetical protein